MAKLVDVPQEAVLQEVLALRSETDRGAAVHGGSLVENALGSLLERYFQVHKKQAAPKNPMATFSGRIKLAEELHLIDGPKAKQLNLLKDIRNHFAHHPLGASFEDERIKALIESLPVTTFSSSDPRLAEMGTHRAGFLSTCAGNAAVLRAMQDHVSFLFQGEAK